MDRLFRLKTLEKESYLEMKLMAVFNFIMSSRITRLNEVFEFFLAKTLEPLSQAELEPMLKQFPKNTAETFSNFAINSIKENCMGEFQTIIDEKNVEERLSNLDHLISQSQGFEVNMNAFNFSPVDPEVLKQKVVDGAKKQEIQKMQDLLNQLNQQVQERTQLKESLERQHQQAEEEMQNVLERIKKVTQ